jgi:hypothetical protein
MAEPNGNVVRLQQHEKRLDLIEPEIASQRTDLLELRGDVRVMRHDLSDVKDDVAEIKDTIKEAAQEKRATSRGEKLAIIAASGAVIVALIDALSKVAGA